MNESDRQILKFTNPTVSKGYLKFLEQREADGRPLNRAELWKHHYQFEVPALILSYGGQAPAHTTVLIYSHAEGRYRHSASEYSLALKATVAAKAEAGNLSADSVERSLKRLERDKLIRREKKRSARGKFAASKITLLRPGTDEPLQTIPSEEGLLTANGHSDCIVVPSESLRALNSMIPAAKAVYLTSLYLATKGLAETVYVEKSEWMRLSGLERCAFNRGLKYCTRKSLLTYRASVLTVNDASTGKPTERWLETGTWDGEPNPRWEVNFDEISPDEWEQLFLAEFGTDPIIQCPQCGNTKKFGLSISKKVFHCFNCGTKGTLAEFIRLHHAFDWPQTRQYIAAQLKSLEVTV